MSHGEAEVFGSCSTGISRWSDTANVACADDDRPAYIKDAETAHVAAEYVRCILRKFPAMKSELRDLLWRIDAGEGVRIDSLDDADTLRGIRGLMGSLNLHRSKTVRSHLSCDGAPSSTKQLESQAVCHHTRSDFCVVTGHVLFENRAGQDPAKDWCGVQ